MGEIGIPRREFFFEIPFWEARRIIRGYRRRERTYAIFTRQQTFLLIQPYLSKTANIRRASDLWKLPWDDEDKEEAPPVSAEDVAQLQAEMAAFKF